MSSDNDSPADDVPIPGERHRHDEAGLVPAFTLVLWVGCVAVGVTGFLTRPAAVPPPKPASQPAVQVISVTLDAEPTPDPPAAQEAAAAPTAAAEMSDPGPAVPSVPTAAVASPAVAFAVPVAGDVRVGPAAQAVPAQRSSGPVVQRIEYGVGAGQQPKPDYPDGARNAGQQGVVTVRMSVDEGGRVARAWVVEASPFPSLNQAAVDAVRNTWHFPTGPPRLYDCPIDFHLNYREN